MQTTFTELTSTRANPHIDPSLHVWGWEVPVYLFLGGLAAGLLILSAWATLRRRQDEYRASSSWMPVLIVPLLIVGLTALFLDLEYKLHVFRFYTTFQLTAPMSWGSWILLVVFATSGLTAVRALYTQPWFTGLAIADLRLLRALSELALRHERTLARANLGLGIALGIYTGILLSAFSARPLWNSSLLGVLFLVSGLSSGAALGALFAARNDTNTEHDFLVRLDLVAIVLELAVIGLWLLGLGTGGEAGREAAHLVLGGPYTAAFWSLVVFVGLLVPAVLEVMSLGGRWRTHAVAPVLVLVGGIALRFIIVGAGQVSETAPSLGIG